MVDVKVMFAGLCGSDITRIKNDPNVNIRSLGHEIVGYPVGAEGTCYVINPFINTKEDDEAQENESLLLCPHCMSLGKQLPGGFGQVITIPARNMWEFNVVDEYKCVGTLVDGIAVIFHGLHMVDINNAYTILVIGDGVIGCLATYIIKKLYPDKEVKIYVRNDNKMALLEKVFNNDIIRCLDESETYDYVFECVGGKQSETLNTAIRMVKKNGGIAVWGAFSEMIETPINYRQLFYKQISLKGINSYCNKYNDFERAVEFARKNCKELYTFITQKIKFDNLEQYIYIDMKNDRNRIKTVFVNE